MPVSTNGDERTIDRLCVYCASSTGHHPAAADSAVALGRLLVAEGIELVYGGAAVGLMGIVADEVLAGGGTVVGILPTTLIPREVAHDGITELVEVDTMHERKAEMMERSDAFVALPGGFGTLEELAEVLTWSQLGIHHKPVGLLNAGGFYDHLLAFFERAVTDGLLKQSNRELLLVDDEPAGLLAALRRAPTEREPKWERLPR